MQAEAHRDHIAKAQEEESQQVAAALVWLHPLRPRLSHTLVLSLFEAQIYH